MVLVGLLVVGVSVGAYAHFKTGNTPASVAIQAKYEQAEKARLAARDIAIKAKLDAETVAQELAAALASESVVVTTTNLDGSVTSTSGNVSATVKLGNSKPAVSVSIK